VVAGGEVPQHTTRAGLAGSALPGTSCAIKEARSGNFTPLGVQGGAGMCWVWSGGSNLASGPLGSVACGPVL
jgi:hypothetical protein